MQIFFSDIDAGAFIFLENVPLETFNILYYLKAYRISNNMIEKLTAQRSEKIIMITLFWPQVSPFNIFLC